MYSKSKHHPVQFGSKMQNVFFTHPVTCNVGRNPDSPKGAGLWHMGPAMRIGRASGGLRQRLRADIRSGFSVSGMWILDVGVMGTTSGVLSPPLLSRSLVAKERWQEGPPSSSYLTRGPHHPAGCSVTQRRQAGCPPAG